MADGARRRACRLRSGFGDNAPPGNMPFPKKANLTAVELLAFFPNTIYRADVIYRLISNGGTRRSIWAIVNTHRDLESEWSANCCGEAMYKTMQKVGYTEWTIKKHDLWHESRKASWESNSLDVGNLQTQGIPAKSVPFRNLAEDVRTMPEGNDALDLTRMVQYCVQNSEDGWTYPEDYEELLDLLGGPAIVQDENTDGARLRTWENRRPPPPLPKRPSPRLQSIELLDGWRKTARSSRGGRGKSGPRVRSSNVPPNAGSLNRRRAARERARTASVDAAEVEAMEELDQEGDYGTPYSRGLVSKPTSNSLLEPIGVASRPRVAVPTLTQIFQAEGVVEETDPYNAYAFEGPRRKPPYRYLGQIAQPHPWDISGWAENLRWAFEQRVLFAQSSPEVSRWNESPEHMARIERERTQRIWASDELLAQMLEDDYN
ncbi:hypothetical protein EJ07DRAFT_111500 [Lizonia empirigonia]|nr:hypothetical protein EJ07DRAFT_111500 [Lizonia empirigonia]